ncbi:MAG: YncE family protein [Thermoplasmatota archaeon]
MSKMPLSGTRAWHEWGENSLRVRGVLLGAGVLAIVLLLFVFSPYVYLLFSAFHVDAGTNAGALGLRAVADVPLEGGPSRLDYAALDAPRSLLFIAHLGADEVEVVNTTLEKETAVIHGISSPHGIVVVPQAHRVFVSATGSQEEVEIDEDSLTPYARGGAGQFPDGVAYAPSANRVFVSDESGGADIVLDGRTLTPVGRVDMHGEVGNTQYNAATGTIVVAAEGREALEVVDPVSLAVERTYALPGCDGAHGFAIDPAGRAAYVSCERNARMLVVNLTDGTISDTFGVGQEPDVLQVDPGLGRLYVASESGVVSVFRVNGTDVAQMGEAYLAPDAHSLAADPSTHRVYVPLEDIDGRAVLRIYEARYP